METRRLICVMAVTVGCSLTATAAHSQARSSPHKLRISVVDAGTHSPLWGSQILVSNQGLSFIVPRSGVVAFEVSAPATDTLVIRRLGYNPVFIAVSLAPRDSTTIVVSLDPIVQNLPDVSIKADIVHGLTKNGFYDRRVRSNGYFVGPDQIEARQPSRLSDLLADNPQVRFFPAASGGRNIRFARAENCAPLVYVDGVLVLNERSVSKVRPFMRGTQHAREVSDDALAQQDQGIDEISVRQVAAIEAYSTSTQAPPQYSAAGASCGILLVWTESFFEHSR